MNDYQMRKSKNKEITGKITTQTIIQQQEMIPQRAPYDAPRTPYELQAKDCTQFATQMRKYSMITLTLLKMS